MGVPTTFSQKPEFGSDSEHLQLVFADEREPWLVKDLLTAGMSNEMTHLTLGSPG